MAKKRNAGDSVKVVILVEGGLVQTVYAPEGSGVEVRVVDNDNLKEEGKNGKQREAILKKTTKGLTTIY